MLCSNRYVIAFFLIFFSATLASSTTQTAEYRNWIIDMKESRKGPFSTVIWFCNDGELLPAKPYACKDHGGGFQHGKLSQKAQILRNKGFWIANFLAGIKTQSKLRRKDFVDWYNQLLIEKFLIRTDRGWILEKAQFYRGAIQEENERDGARQLLLALVAKKEWITQRYTALRIGVQLLPHGQDSASIQRVRQMSISLGDRDRSFNKLRAKIHISPDADDARLVREYASKIKNRQRQTEYLKLAKEIDRVFQSPPFLELVEKMAKRFSAAPWLKEIFHEAGEAYKADDSVENHHSVTAQLLADLRDSLPKIRRYSTRLRVLDLSLAIETVYFKASTQLRAKLDSTNRQQRISWLQNASLAAYGTGYINKRSLYALQESLSRLEVDHVSLDTYFKELNYLARTPGWSTQGLRFQFYRSIEKLTEIEPMAQLFIQDLLRGSPMLFFSQTLDSLVRDGNQLAGVTHKIFEQKIGVGFHALNPGLARGKLYTKVNIHEYENFDSQGIYLLPETISELPPIAGIITAGEGNPLSHVQLLARNLGIPNVSVNENVLQQLQSHDGETIVLAVSPNGLVELNSDSVQWQEFFNKKTKQEDVVIRPDLEKLDLSVREFVDLSELRASDSGRIVGPKAAKLGELFFHYPEKVAKAIAIPFGIFKQVVLDKPYKNTDRTVFEWMEHQYALIDAFMVDVEQRKKVTESFRKEIYDIILNTHKGNQFRKELRKAMKETFGNSNKVGVFIRSDTNVEDLPGFTGAGLNLTLFNIAGFNKILKGINKVWASPFTARAFSWRQMLMETPQHVYPAVLIMQTVANDKSGVMVTQDIKSDDKEILSVAVNEGVGGAVDGQSAESLSIDTRNGNVRLLATATAPFRKVPLARGGIVKLPVSNSESVLTLDEIRQLVQFAKELPNSFPPIIDEQNNSVPADIEFGFYKGKLQLFQLRPFLESRKAQGSSYLLNLDKAIQGSMDSLVTMGGVPE